MLIGIKIKRTAPEQEIINSLELLGWGVPVRIMRVRSWVALIYDLDPAPIKELLPEVRSSAGRSLIGFRKLFKTRSYR